MVRAVTRKASAALWLAAGAAWVVTLIAGFTVLLRFATTPALASGAYAARWPQGSALPRPAGRPLLLVFAHPGCPCTRATVAELARLMARHGDRAQARMVVVQPPGAGDELLDMDLGTRAASIPGVELSIDRDGVEARRFGAVTSGLVLLYDTDARLIFHGGITASRGHEGRSFGQERIASLLTHGRADSNGAPVFGCALLEGGAEPPPARQERELPRSHAHARQHV